MQHSLAERPYLRLTICTGARVCYHDLDWHAGVVAVHAQCFTIAHLQETVDRHAIQEEDLTHDILTIEQHHQGARTS